jgi:hypothetical protein
MNKRPAATLSWTCEEDDQLRAAAASGETVAATSKRLSRSEKAIWHRARRLRIEFAQQRKRLGSVTRLAATLKVKGK